MRRQNEEAAMEASLGIVLSAYRSFRGRRSHVAYVSMPITTGKRYYDVLASEGVGSASELREKHGPDALKRLVIEPNIREGTALADRLGLTTNLICIAPSVFDASSWNWTQKTYMSLWYNVIAEMAGSHYVMDGWEYSIGGAREVMFTMLWQWRYIRSYNREQAIRNFGLEKLFEGLDHQAMRALVEDLYNLRVYDSAGQIVTIVQAFTKLLAAIADLQARGFQCKELLGIANTLQAIPVLSPYWKDGPSIFLTEEYLQGRETLKRLAVA